MPKAKAHHILIIPQDGSETRRVRGSFKNPDAALAIGTAYAIEWFGSAGCEVVVIETKSREAIRNDFTGGNDA